jgi:hypothetical protein
VNGNIKTPTGSAGGQHNHEHDPHHFDGEHETTQEKGHQHTDTRGLPTPHTAALDSPKKFNRRKLRSPNKGSARVNEETGQRAVKVEDGSIAEEHDKDGGIVNGVDLGRVENFDGINEKIKLDGESSTGSDSTFGFLFDPKYVTSMNLNLEFTTNAYYRHVIPPFSVKLLNSYNNHAHKGLSTVVKCDVQFPYDHLRKVCLSSISWPFC